MYDRLYNNKTPIDLAFIGSSHTINAITEHSIQQAANCEQLNIVNLGYCRMGRNMSYVLLKELLANKSIKSLVLEVREEEDRYSHPVFPFLASSSDVLGASLLFNRDYLVDHWDHFTYRCQLIQEKVFGQPIPKGNQTSNYGFMASSDTLSIAQAAEIKKKRAKHTTNQSQLSNSFYRKYPKSYLKRITELCEAEQIQLYFLYLPQYETSVTTPSNAKHYQSTGILLQPPDHLLKDRDNWHDKDHFNINGANKLSKWLGSILKCNGDFL